MDHKSRPDGVQARGFALRVPRPHPIIAIERFSAIRSAREGRLEESQRDEPRLAITIPKGESFARLPRREFVLATPFFFHPTFGIIKFYREPSVDQAIDADTLGTHPPRFKRFCRRDRGGRLNSSTLRCTAATFTSGMKMFESHRHNDLGIPSIENLRRLKVAYRRIDPFRSPTL